MGKIDGMTRSGYFFTARVASLLTLGLLANGFSTVYAFDDTTSPLTARQLYYKSRPKPATKPSGSSARPKPDVPSTKPPDTDQPKAAAVLDPDAEAVYVGLRYSLIDGDTMQEVDPSRVFHTNDHIRLKIQPNSNGYLYVLNQDPLGVWTTLFPSADIAQNDNRIERGRVTEVPSGQNFEFDNVPGIEKLFVVLSRNREPDLDAVIESLKRGQSGRQPVPDSGKLLQAQNRMPSSELERLRAGKLTSRGIHVQPMRVSNGAGENAVYVAVGDQNGSRAVTEIVLRHE
jgi:Domain of unknown function (DUF4384)